MRYSTQAPVLDVTTIRDFTAKGIAEAMMALEEFRCLDEEQLLLTIRHRFFLRSSNEEGRRMMELCVGSADYDEDKDIVKSIEDALDFYFRELENTFCL